MSAAPRPGMSQYDAVMKVLLAGGLAGVSAAALREILSSFDEDDAPAASTRNLTMSIAAPYDLNAKRKQKKPAPRKSLTGEYKFSSVKEAGDDDLRSPTQKDMGIPNTEDTRDIIDMPSSYPLILGAAGLGTYGGYKGLSWLAKKYRKWRSDAELAEARAEYEELLKERYGLAKSSALATHIDEKYAEFEKQSDLFNKGYGMSAGTYLTLAAAIAAISHLASKSRSDELDPAKVKRRLIAKRMQIMQAAMPPTAVFRSPELEGDDIHTAPGLGPMDNIKRSEDLSELLGSDEATGLIEGMSPENITDVKGAFGQAAETASQDEKTADEMVSGLDQNAVANGASKVISKKMRGTLQDSMGGLGSIFLK